MEKHDDDSGTFNSNDEENNESQNTNEEEITFDLENENYTNAFNEAFEMNDESLETYNDNKKSRGNVIEQSQNEYHDKHKQLQNNKDSSHYDTTCTNGLNDAFDSCHDNLDINKYNDKDNLDSIDKISRGKIIDQTRNEKLLNDLKDETNRQQKNALYEESISSMDEIQKINRRKHNNNFRIHKNNDNNKNKNPRHKRKSTKLLKMKIFMRSHLVTR